MKNLNWYFFPIVAIFMLVGTDIIFPIKRWMIDEKLSTNTSIVDGKLINHKMITSIDRKGHRAISIVEFEVGGKVYLAEMDRLKVAVGITLQVKYNNEDPEWHRVIVPDSLKQYQCAAAYHNEELFYTWPPTKPDGIRIMKVENIREGPY